MKPVSVRFQCFGPYVDEQFIDFKDLEKSGLFLICGETGAGKTTILDAMCYALYGKSSGGFRGELEDMPSRMVVLPAPVSPQIRNSPLFSRSLKSINCSST